MSERGMLLTFPALETLLQVAPEPAAAALQPVLTKLLGLLLAGEVRAGRQGRRQAGRVRERGRGAGGGGRGGLDEGRGVKWQWAFARVA